MGIVMPFGVCFHRGCVFAARYSCDGISYFFCCVLENCRRGDEVLPFATVLYETCDTACDRRHALQTRDVALDAERRLKAEFLAAIVKEMRSNDYRMVDERLNPGVLPVQMKTAKKFVHRPIHVLDAVNSLSSGTRL